MEKALGIGGLFFRAKDPKALAQWYSDHLGVSQASEVHETSARHQSDGATVFAPFSQNADYFNMDDDPNGWLVRLKDPEDNPIELWESAGRSREIGES